MNTGERKHVGRDAKGKRPVFFDTSGMDQMMSMVMVLANEVSVLHDRVDSIERVAKAHDLDLAAGIEALELDQTALESREAWRQDFLERLFYLMRKDAAESAAAETTESYEATISDVATG
jgi:acyl-CoA reductase-like NAD-dependent aldehyde dehydrogenase